MVSLNLLHDSTIIQFDVSCNCCNMIHAAASSPKGQWCCFVCFVWSLTLVNAYAPTGLHETLITVKTDQANINHEMYFEAEITVVSCNLCVYSMHSNIAVAHDTLIYYWARQMVCSQKSDTWLDLVGALSMFILNPYIQPQHEYSSQTQCCNPIFGFQGYNQMIVQEQMPAWGIKSISAISRV